MQATTVILTAAACVSATVVPAAPTPPFWGPTWTAPFAQSITIYTMQWNNSVTFLYDSTTKPVGSSLYAHSKGQNDEMCTSIKGKELSDEPCNLLASVDTWRYVIFPESGTCCRYCNTSDFCGIVRPDWLQQNATYVDTKVINGLTCNGWVKAGGEKNYWYAEQTTQQPCLYYEGYPTLPNTINIWNFTVAAFNRSPIPASAFAVPAGCSSMCDHAAQSYQERLEARYAAGEGQRAFGIHVQ